MENTTPPPETPKAPTSLLGEALDKAPKQDSAPKKEGDDAPKPPEPAATGAPEKYTDFKLPEGFTLPAETLTEATGLFKDMNLSQDQAQKLVDFHTKAVQSTSDGIAKLWQDTQDTWIDELKSDPKYGKLFTSGELGAGISKMISSLDQGLATAFRDAFNFTGAGNNPAIVRGLYELSKLYNEPSRHVSGNPPASVKSKPSAAAALYPNLVKKE